MKKYLSVFILFILSFSSCIETPIQKSLENFSKEIYKNPSYSVEERAGNLLNLMTLDEKIGQMTQIEKEALASTRDIARYHLGSLLSGGGSRPLKDDAQGWLEAIDVFQKEAMSTRLAIPLLYGIDAVHGTAKVRNAVVFPHNIGLGATRDKEIIEKTARITALEMLGSGQHWNFSPCIAVPQDERWGRTYEGFGETPELATMAASAMIKGYQGSSEEGFTGILACAKHYIADGGTLNGVDQGNADISEEDLRKIHLPGYKAAISAGTGSIMVSFSSFQGKKLHGHKYLLSDVLKGELGFQGFLISDYAAIDQLSTDYYSNIVESINAGLDMIMVPYDYHTFESMLKKAVETGDIPLSRIDDAVKRILRAKFQIGLFEKPYGRSELSAQVGSPEHRAVAREAVRKSLVLLKNKGILPLKKNLSKIQVTGKNADNLGWQCGGWTMSWQGLSGNKLTSGTSILQAIKSTVSNSTVVEFDAKGDKIANDADVIIAVIGETSYAEMKGDRGALNLDEADIDVLKKVKTTGIPLIVVLISGRPLIITEEWENWKALIAAWLPGTEGQGVTDVLFGDYSPTGKLPHSWPRSMEQIPINYGDKNYDPLFQYNFGLSY